MPRERVRKKKAASPATPNLQSNQNQQRPFSVSPGDSSCSSDSLFSGSVHPSQLQQHYPPHMQQQQHHSPYPNHYVPHQQHPGHHMQQQHHGPPPGSHYGPNPSAMYSCSKCHKAINERTVSMCDNRFWHSACLTCQMCGHTPSPHSGESLYAYRGSLICKSDYIRVNCVCKCCSRPITQSDMVIRAKNVGWVHDKCVFCRQCNARLHPGDRYWWTTDNMLVCQKCIGPNGNQMMANMMGGPNGPSGPMDGYHMGPGGPQGPHMMGPNGPSRQMGGGGPPNAYMGGPGGPNGGPMMGPNGPMIKMEPNGYGNGMNGMHHMSSPHMNHHHGQHPSAPGTPVATATPPPTAAPTTTGGRRGRKKQHLRCNIPELYNT